MKTRVTSVSLIALAILTVVPALLSAQKTSFDFDRTVDFSKFKTFAWSGEAPIPDPFLHKRIVTAIESQLVARGLTRTDTEPDLYVRYLVALDTRTTITGWNGDGFGPFSGGWAGQGRVDLQQNQLLVGTLLIDVADAAKRELVWRGLAVGDIDIHAKPEKRDASITKAVAKILKNYPPPAARG